MNLNRMFLALLAALLIASPAAGAVLTAGIPADAHVMYGADFTSPALQAIAKTSFDKIKSSPAFAKFLEEFKKEAGFTLSPDFLDRLLTIAGFRVGLTINRQDAELPPGVVVVLQFKDAAAAQNAEATLKEKCAKDFAKEIVFGEMQVGGKKLVSLDKTESAEKEFAKNTFKKVTVNYLLEGDSIAIYFVPKDEAHRKAVLPAVEASLAALADPKKSISETPGYKDLLARAGGDSPITVFVSSELVDIANKQNAKIPDVVEWLGMTSLPSADYLNIKSKVTLKLKDLEKKPIEGMKIPSAVLKSFLAGGDCGMAALPKDTLFAVGLTLNLTKDVLALPEIAGVLAEQKKNGLDLEEKFLKWFDGELAVGVGAYVPPTPDEMKKGEFNAPDLYIVLKTKDPLATMKSIEELLKFSPMPMQPVDKKDMGEMVKNVPLPMIPPSIKKFDLHYGVAGPFFVIATTKEGMQKALESGKTPGLVGTPEFKESIEGKGFAAFYANVEEISKLGKLVKELNPQAIPTDEMPPFQKRMGFTVAFPGDSIVLAMGSKADYNEAIDFMLNEFKKKLSGKGAAPAGDAPKVEPGHEGHDHGDAPDAPAPAPGGDEGDDNGGDEKTE